MKLHKTTESCTAWFSIIPNLMSKFRTITILKNFVKKLLIQLQLVGMSMVFTAPNFNSLSATLHDLSPTNKILILTFNRPPR
jgi:hypothetical protein